MQLKVSIVGAGPAGFALATDLENHGTDVLVYSHPSHNYHANQVIASGHLLSSGAIQSSTTPKITLDMSEVVEFSKIIILTVPSTGQETIVKELKKFDLCAHTIIAIPGNLFSLVFGEEIKARCVLETNLSPYSCRMIEGELSVLGKKNRFSIGAWPGEIDPVLKEEINSIFPMELHWCSNVVEVSLLNVNGVFHPVMMLMNASRIEGPSPFFLYHTGISRSVSNAILALDQIRLQIGAAFGFELNGVIEVSNACYNQNFTDLVDLAQNSEPHNTLLAPETFDNRYITEDVPDLLVSWFALAGILGIEAEAVRAVIIMAGMATGSDYMREGRGLKNLRLEGLGRGELVERFGVRRT
ncbi:hypothetical protein NHQ30_003989 [Ciborinia camelliae]|nr:hypothetical protein NHQ30_003989 [Ciborinia camelliae]